jgi:hypothetical protein
MLSKSVPITDVAHRLGHRDVRVTFRDLRSSRAVCRGPRDHGTG